MPRILIWLLWDDESVNEFYDRACKFADIEGLVKTFWDWVTGEPNECSFIYLNQDILFIIINMISSKDIEL